MFAMVFNGFYNDDDYMVASAHLFWGLYGLFICLIKTFAMLSCFLIISSRGFGIAIWPLYQGYGDAIWLSSLFIKLQYFIHYAFMYMGPRMAFDSVLSLGFISSAVFSTDIFLGTYQINTLHFELVVWSFLLWLILQYCWFLCFGVFLAVKAYPVSCC